MSRQKKSPGGNLGGDATRAAFVNRQYTAGSATTPIYVGGRVVGNVAGDVFRKQIRGSAHMLRSPRAIAFDVSTLHDAERAGARRVEVTDTDSGRVYRAALSTVWARGWAFNRGHGDQWGVPIGVFNKDDAPAQLSLFGGAA